MKIDLEKLNTKLNSILDKDLDSIINKKTYIPSLGSDYTKKELQEWLDVRSNFLKSMKDMSENNRDIEVNNIYNSLSVENKNSIDNNIDNNFNENNEDYEKLVLISLGDFIKI